jgi:hypothetical protein
MSDREVENIDKSMSDVVRRYFGPHFEKCSISSTKIKGSRRAIFTKVTLSLQTFDELSSLSDAHQSL